MRKSLIKLLRGALPVLLSVTIVSCAAASPRVGDSSNSSPEASNTRLSTVAAQGQGAGREPARPSATVDTTMPRTTGRRIAVAGGASAARNLQAALSEANPGDVLALEAGAVFIGNFTLPKKATGQQAGWIIIRSAAADSELPPPGTRVTPAQAGRLPKLVSPNADPALRTVAGAHHFRLIGIEFTVAEDRDLIYELVQLGTSLQSTLAEVPHDIIIDRCYIHGRPDRNARRGVALNSANTAVIDSYIADIHEQGADSQAICGWNGPGPFKIVNNYLEGAGENVMFGGADPRINSLVPSDIEFRRNHCFKPLSWNKNDPSFAGKKWTVKNSFELKNARRVLIDGNVFENNWADGQVGFAILFTPRNQENTAPWSVVEDVTFTNNIVKHTAGGLNILGRDYNSPSEQTKRIKVKNNLFDDVGGQKWGSNGRFLQINETADIEIDHNTVLHTGNIITAHGKPNERFVFTNNLIGHNEYGVIGDGTGPGMSTLTKYFPEAVFKKNVIAGGRREAYPADNFFPPTIDEAKFVDRAKGNYRLAASSAFKSAGAGGQSVGCDMAALEAAIGAMNSSR